MSYLPLGLFALLVVALDQLSKFLVLEQIPFGAIVPGVKGLFHLTYVQNFGAAFSMLQGHRWLFIAVFILFIGLLFWGIQKKVLPFSRFEMWCLAAVIGGGLGNILDRVFRGFVVDMIAVEFIDFPVFNVADCFITCGAIALIVHLVFWNQAFWKDGKEKK